MRTYIDKEDAVGFATGIDELAGLWNSSITTLTQAFYGGTITFMKILTMITTNTR
jgi:hypothetical protein